MSEHDSMLSDTAARVFADVSGADFARCGAAIADAGLGLVMVAEAKGGFGGSWEDANRVFFAAGQNALAYPIAESAIAAALLSQCGLAAEGTLTIAQCAEGKAVLENGALRFSGTLGHVAYGGDAQSIAALVEVQGKTHAAIFSRAAAAHVERRANPAGEARDVLTFENASALCAVTHWTSDRLFHALALARAGQMAGAMAAALAIAAQYARERQQFGKPLAAFQAIQQQLAVLAEETAAARAAASAAARAADRGRAQFEIACAKLRCNMAAGEAASIAHQVHGAIGFTWEYALQKFTRRLWAWRSEYGNDRHWADAIGRLAAARGADGFWPGLTSGFAA